MAYTKHNFQSGQVLTAAEMNEIDNQIYNNAEDISELKSGNSGTSINNPLTGKTIIALGDSITAANNGYVEKIATKYDMTCTNYAKAGSTLVSGVEGRYHICELIDNMTDTADYVILSGGINDFTYYLGTKISLGDITTSFSGGYDTTTIVGALEYICYKATQKWQGTAQILYVVCHANSSDGNHIRKYMRDLVPAIKQVCGKWSIPVLDLSSLVPKLATSDELLAYTSLDDDGNRDGTHPTSDGYDKFYVPYVEKALMYGGFVSGYSYGTGGSSSSSDSDDTSTGSWQTLVAGVDYTLTTGTYYVVDTTKSRIDGTMSRDAEIMTKLTVTQGEKYRITGCGNLNRYGCVWFTSSVAASSIANGSAILQCQDWNDNDASWTATTSTISITSSSEITLVAQSNTTFGGLKIEKWVVST